MSLESSRVNNHPFSGHYFLNLGWALLVACFLSACVSTGENSSGDGLIGATIVERSKESAPSWTIGKCNVLSTTDQAGFFDLVYFKDHLLNLPLGIKQAQLSALEVSQRALEERLKVQVLDLAKAKSTTPRTQTVEFDRQVAATVKSFHAENAKVQDMYFERLSHSPPLDDGNIRETYRVFVLVRINGKRVPDLIQSLGRRLTSCNDASLRNLGLLIRQEAEQMTSH